MSNELKPLELPTVKFEDSMYRKGNNKWLAETLYRQAKKEKAEVFDFPVQAINLSDMYIEYTSMLEFINHCKRINDCSLDYPIILDNEGFIADGNHRVIKAILSGKTSIKAMRLKEMPEVDYIDSDDKETSEVKNLMNALNELIK